MNRKSKVVTMVISGLVTAMPFTVYADEIKPYQSTEIQPYQSTPVQPVQSTPIQPYQSTPVQPVQSTPIQPYQSTPVQPVQSTPIQPYQSTSVQPVQSTSIQPYQSTPVQPVQSTPIQSHQSTPFQPVTPAQPQNSISIHLQLGNKSAYINGKLKPVDVAPTSIDGRTMVPLRFISETIGAKVDWKPETQEVDVTLNGIKISLWIGHTDKVVVMNNGQYQYPKLDVAPQIIDGSTLVPLRFISENLGLPVHYDSNTQQIAIGDQSTTSSSGLDMYQSGEIQLNKPGQFNENDQKMLQSIDQSQSSGDSGGSGSGSLFSPADGFRYSGGSGSSNFWAPGWLNPGGGF